MLMGLQRRSRRIVRGWIVEVVWEVWMGIAMMNGEDVVQVGCYPQVAIRGNTA